MVTNFLRVLGRHYIRPPHFASKVSYSASPLSAFLKFVNSSNSLLSRLRPNYRWAKYVFVVFAIRRRSL